MAMVNAKAIGNALKIFIKENGREPTHEEFEKICTGKQEPKKRDLDEIK